MARKRWDGSAEAHPFNSAFSVRLIISTPHLPRPSHKTLNNDDAFSVAAASQETRTMGRCGLNRVRYD